MLRLDEPAPPISLRNQFGITTGLQQLRGHFVVLWWQRTFGNKGAEVIARSLRDRYSDFTMRNAVTVGISCDTPADIRRFHERLALPFDVLSDSAGHAGEAYQMAAWWRVSPDLPLVFVLDGESKIRAIHQVGEPTTLAATLLVDIIHAAA